MQSLKNPRRNPSGIFCYFLKTLSHGQTAHKVDKTFFTVYYGTLSVLLNLLP